MNEECEKAQKKILSVAKAIVERRISVIEGARAIAGARFAAGIDSDPDILPFVGIDSDTDAFPMGEIRKHWNP